jgi:dihydrofolate synthase / folylpolyglutamate synthase
MSSPTYEKTLEWMYAQLPMFTRVGGAAYKEGLGNILKICEALGSPHLKFKSIHVAGTNGKGSTSHSIAAILQIAGYRTGLYTSPHLYDFRERIRINGEKIAKESVVAFIENHKSLIDEVRPSFFEITVAMAFDYFAKEKVDYAVIEVGMGGRLDSTNIIRPVLSVITSISFDHKQFLGDTLQKIAAEKAGIIKYGVPVVISTTQSEVATVFERKAADENAPIFFAEEFWIILAEDHVDSSQFLRRYGIESKRRPQMIALQCDLLGNYHSKNLSGILESVYQLQQQGVAISWENVVTAIGQVKKLTELRGRWQILSTKPLIITDIGHNPSGIEEAMKQLAAIPYARLHIVLGVMQDKELNEIASFLPKEAFYYAVVPELPRAMPSDQLTKNLLDFGLNAEDYSSVAKGIEIALSRALSDDLVFIGGSTFVVAEIPEWLRKE